MFHQQEVHDSIVVVGLNHPLSSRQDRHDGFERGLQHCRHGGIGDLDGEHAPPDVVSGVQVGDDGSVELDDWKGQPDSRN